MKAAISASAVWRCWEGAMSVEEDLTMCMIHVGGVCGGCVFGRSNFWKGGKRRWGRHLTPRAREGGEVPGTDYANLLI